MPKQTLADIFPDNIRTVHQFAEACRYLGGDDIYELFEDEISDDLRCEIYARCEDTNTTEPARAAFIAIGTQYNVQSLIEW